MVAYGSVKRKRALMNETLSFDINEILSKPFLLWLVYQLAQSEKSPSSYSRLIGVRMSSAQLMPVEFLQHI